MTVTGCWIAAAIEGHGILPLVNEPTPDPEDTGAEQIETINTACMWR